MLISQENHLVMHIGGNVNCLFDDPADARRYSVPGPNRMKYATEASDDADHWASEGRNNTSGIKITGIRDSLLSEHRIGTWNTRGLLHPGKLSIVDEERERLNISILGVSETHLRGQGHFRTTLGSTLYFSGNDSCSKNGVGFLLPPKMNKYVLGYNPISDKIITMKLNTKPCLLNIVQVYAPTSTASDEDIDEFYGTLEKTLDDIPGRQITIIIGDWNAKIGKSEPGTHSSGIVGRYGLGIRNERGQRFAEFCLGRKLAIMNTLYQHHPRRLYTWRSPGERYRNQIDYIMINTRWRSSVKNVKTFPGADCGSDHVLLVAVFSLRLKVNHKSSRPVTRSLNPSQQLCFRNLTEERLAEAPLTDTTDVNSQWKHLKAIMNDSLKQLVPKGNKDHKRMTWISEHTWNLIQRRKETKIKGLQNAAVVGIL
ncbi:craniofacial development protein 2-like [Leptidea sinapis]|uniref:craniofacial development protein 2-like n=1 Tax=Leptidea sinapis TaxID=189913 RepID=UPI0021C32DBF|nr:craniofacial development protein 2-like [Leptidea sinapis]